MPMARSTPSTARCRRFLCQYEAIAAIKRGSTYGGSHLRLVEASALVLVRWIGRPSPCNRPHAAPSALYASTMQSRLSEDAEYAVEAIQSLFGKAQSSRCDGLAALHGGIVPTSTAVALKASMKPLLQL